MGPIVGWVTRRRFTARVYLGSIAILYVYISLVDYTVPGRIFGFDIVQQLIPGKNDARVAGTLFLAAGVLCAVAALRYSGRTRMVANAAALGIACGWTMLLLVAAITTGEGWGQFGIWFWMTFIVAASVQTPIIPPTVEDEVYDYVTKLLSRYNHQTPPTAAAPAQPTAHEKDASEQ